MWTKEIKMEKLHFLRLVTMEFKKSWRSWPFQQLFRRFQTAHSYQGKQLTQRTLNKEDFNSRADWDLVQLLSQKIWTQQLASQMELWSPWILFPSPVCPWEKLVTSKEGFSWPSLVRGFISHVFRISSMFACRKTPAKIGQIPKLWSQERLWSQLETNQLKPKWRQPPKSMDRFWRER